MELFPAIDLYEGQVVRLTKGDFNQKTVYSSDPAHFAAQWQQAGAQWLHVIDLEGAKTGTIKNLESVLKIRKATHCKMQFGGGLRSLEAIDQLLVHGIERVIVGTKAMDRKFLESAVKDFGSRLAISLDVRDGVVQTQGWLDSGNPTLTDAINLLNEYPIATVIYTNIQRDGMMAGPDFQGLDLVLKSLRANVVLSGGVSTLDDVKASAAVKAQNFEGAIIGKALYEGKIDLKEALGVARK